MPQAMPPVTSIHERHFRALFESVLDVVLIADDDRRFLEVNPAAAQLLAVPRHELIGRRLDDFATPEELSFLQQDWREFLVDGFREGEFVLQCADGALRTVEFRARANFVPGRHLSVLRDVTRRKEAEQRLARSREELAALLVRERETRREAEVANRLKDEFLGVVSHELRTPLTAILGWIRMLRAGTVRPELEARALETIERNAEAQAQLIEDILDASRIMAGKMRLEMKPIALAQVIDAAVDAVRLAARSKRVRIDVRVDRSIGAVSGDGGRLRQVVVNLLSNAIKFTPERGSVSVRLDRVGNQARVTVTDDGIGIEAEFLPHVFERFRQADGTPARRHGGLGLGLAIVREIVEGHGGAVSATSPGHGLGATFEVRFPLVEAAVVAPPAASDRIVARYAPPLLEGVRILVVDDDVDGLLFVGEALRAAGARVESATTAAEALRALSASRVDVLVSDIGLPDVDGCELLTRVRRLGASRGGDIPALALTAYAGAHDRARVLAAGYHLPARRAA